MKKILVSVMLAGLLIWPGASSAQALNTLSVSQLQAILASLQAQLNALIAQLNQLQQQENNSKPIIKPIESIKSMRVTAPSGSTHLDTVPLEISWTPYKGGDFVYYHVSLENSISRSGSPLGLNVSKNKNSIIVTPLVLKGAIKETLSNSGGMTADQIKDGYYVKVQARNNSEGLSEASSRQFSIVSRPVVSESGPTISVLSPNGGESYKNTDKITITYYGTNLSNEVNAYLYSPTYGNMAFHKDVSLSGDFGTGKGIIVLDLATNAITDLIKADQYKINVCDPNNSPAGLSGKDLCDLSDGYITITAQETPSRAGTINVKVLKGGIYCIKAPCEFPLAGAQVSLYDKNKVLVGVQTVGVDGLATFPNLNPGVYTVNVGAANYATDVYSVGLLAGQVKELEVMLRGNITNTSQTSASSELASVLQSLQRVLGTLSPALGH